MSVVKIKIQRNFACILTLCVRCHSVLAMIRFNADTSAGMRWQFKPQQKDITIVPGETALAFYSAKNPTDRPVTGISTYNVVPFEAGQYFNKIQCFCFEEQILNPNEQVRTQITTFQLIFQT
ncbi:Cytochrome c oxidase assembly protein COX11, mitochondrial [Geodia barretti]|uniref:Cytochrome c oxidase assembly protein COX11, mitochondrial n=1 Tax=Geodia barretti TaxID=519541 RepID=A0AA35RW81_GEOBA|nr:Cytochrome c oxidase assembly protein COX11, mitochondrial [Geodia barretti]